ncbi:s-adenosyl-l-methionine-dependent methyltransferase protein [Rutstroemia sp. NJR-2017a BBW]|nr:s-adenosyl-l-methionine-dependent methyltransferase protein [Rutstroemia sp. NJR-2017a BBW]
MSSSPNRIVELSALIHENTIKVDEFITANGLPTPSFDISQPPVLPLPPHIDSLRKAVIAASDELKTLMLGPIPALMDNRHNSLTSLNAIAKFGIANTFPATETSTFNAIAQATSLPESDIRRIVRHAMTYHVFREPTPGIVAHTALSKALIDIPPLRSLVGFLAQELWASSTKMVDAMVKWPGSEEPNQAGFNLAHNTELPMFDFIKGDSLRAQQMAAAMALMHSDPGYDIKYALDNFPWGAAAQGVLVDPVKEADIYFLRWILHDSDKYALKILQNTIPALKPGARILVLDMCLPPPCVLSPYQEREARAFDLAMKEVQNAKERDEEEWATLFTQADPSGKLKFEGVKTPEGSVMSMISAVWTG